MSEITAGQRDAFAQALRRASQAAGISSTDPWEAISERRRHRWRLVVDALDPRLPRVAAELVAQGEDAVAVVLSEHQWHVVLSVLVGRSEFRHIAVVHDEMCRQLDAAQEG